MAPKTWTAEDLQLGGLRIDREGDSLHIQRRYRFLDAADDVIEEIKGGNLVVEIDLADLPANILAALSDIDTWTNNQALLKEGINGCSHRSEP